MSESIEAQAQKLIKAAESMQKDGIEKAQAQANKGKIGQAAPTEATKALKAIGGGMVEAVYISADKCRIYYTTEAVLTAFAAAYGVSIEAVYTAIRALSYRPLMPYLMAAAREAATSEALYSLIAPNEAQEAANANTEAAQSEAV